MAWIESHQSLKDHPKTKRAARLAGVNVPQLVGHLHCLWWWALDYAQDGRLDSYDVADIEDAALWDGDEGKLYGALCDCGGNKPGFIEIVDESRQIHDWFEYAGKLIAKRRTDADRKKTLRPAELQRHSSGTPAAFQRTSDGTPAELQRRSQVPTNQPTVPNQPTNQPVGEASDDALQDEVILPYREGTQPICVCNPDGRSRVMQAIEKTIGGSISPKERIDLISTFEEHCRIGLNDIICGGNFTMYCGRCRLKALDAYNDKVKQQGKRVGVGYFVKVFRSEVERIHAEWKQRCRA